MAGITGILFLMAILPAGMVMALRTMSSRRGWIERDLARRVAAAGVIAAIAAFEAHTLLFVAVFNAACRAQGASEANVPLKYLVAAAALFLLPVLAARSVATLWALTVLTGLAVQVSVLATIFLMIDGFDRFGECYTTMGDQQDQEMLVTIQLIFSAFCCALFYLFVAADLGVAAARWSLRRLRPRTEPPTRNA